MNRRGVAIILLLSAALPSRGLRADARRESLGARPLSMGGAFLAVAGDPSSPFWNPAALSRAEQTWGGGAGRFTRAPGVPRRDLGWASYAEGSSDGKSSVGAWWAGDRDKRSARWDALAVTGSRDLSSSLWGGRLSAGLSAKFLGTSFEAPGRTGASALGVDAGLLYARGPWSLGASARDLNEPRLGGGADAKAPAFYGLGAAFRAGERTLFALDATQASRGEPLRLKLGAERRLLKDSLSLRAGLSRARAAAGIGVGPGRGPVSLDYGFSLPFNLKKEDRLHMLSLRMSFGRPAPDAPAPAYASPPSTAPAPGSLQWRTAPSRPSYPLGADDVVQISVKNHPELDATTTVDPRGFIHLSFIGDLDVKGLAPQDLEAALKKIYAGFFSEAPAVTVAVKDYNSRFVYVVGAVKFPGKYPLKGSPMTLRDVVILAGQPTERAALWRVFIVRQTPKGPKPFAINFNKIYYRGQLDRDVEIQGGDIVYVPMGFMDVLSLFIGRIVGPILGAARNAAVAAGGGI